jgi:drug/metabolite transporter (DMT)-like permease
MMSAIQATVSRRKMIMSLAITYILISVVAGGAGQILLKHGMTLMGEVTLAPDQIVRILWRMATNPYVVGGLSLYGCGTIFWLAALSRVDLSFAYPFASLSYIVMLLASWQVFNETISPLRLFGSFIVGLGVFLISRS